MRYLLLRKYCTHTQSITSLAVRRRRRDHKWLKWKSALVLCTVFLPRTGDWISHIVSLCVTAYQSYSPCPHERRLELTTSRRRRHVAMHAEKLETVAVVSLKFRGIQFINHLFYNRLSVKHAENCNSIASREKKHYGQPYVFGVGELGAVWRMD